MNAYDNDLDIMRAPHPANDPRVVFCGEHLSKAYFQCVDGAYDTGVFLPLYLTLAILVTV